jgi:hypothetical protein
MRCVLVVWVMVYPYPPWRLHRKRQRQMERHGSSDVNGQLIARNRRITLVFFNKKYDQKYVEKKLFSEVQCMLYF